MFVSVVSPKEPKMLRGSCCSEHRVLAIRQRSDQVLASNTMTSHEWEPSVFLNGDIAEKISKIKRQEGPDLHIYGSANLVQTLLKHDLVDAL